MKLNELKEWINSLPPEFDEYTVVNGEYGVLDGEHFYRVDKPVTTLTVDDDDKEIVILNDTDKPLNLEEE